MRRTVPLTLAMLLLPFAGRMRKAGRRMGRMLVVLFLLAAGVLSVTGCGSASSGLFTQAPKSYTVTATVSSGALSQSTTMVMNVQ